MAEDTLTYARVLAERPPLRRLIAEPGRGGLAPFLRRFCDTGELDACAVFDGAQVVASTRRRAALAATVHDRRRSRASASWRCRPARSTRWSARSPNYRRSTPRSASWWCTCSTTRLAEVAVGAQRPAGAAHQLPHVQRAARQRIHLAAFAGADRRPLRRAAHRPRWGCTPRAFRCSPSSGEGIALIETRASSAETDRAVSSLVWRLIITAFVFALLALVAGVLLGWRVTKPAEALTDAARAARPGRFRDVDSHRRARRNRPAGAHHGRHAPQPRRPQLRAAPSRGRSAGGARGRGRGRVRRRPGTQHPLPQSAGRAVVRHRSRTRPSASSAATCSSPAARGSPTGTRPCATTACPILRARQAGSAQAVEQLQTRSGNRQTVITSSRVVNGLQVQVLRDETELEGVRRARDTVLANVSHEFRTPLAAQLASIELLREGLDYEPAARSSRNWCCRWSAARCASRGSSTTCSRACASSPASSTCAARASSSPTWSTMRARWSRRCCASAASRSKSTCRRASTLQGDATRLTQVFVNLHRQCQQVRARRHAGARRRARATDACISAWVEDSGPGLPEGDARQHLRALQARRHAGAGAGRSRPRAVDLAFHRRAPRRQHHRRAHRRRATRVSR